MKTIQQTISEVMSAVGSDDLSQAEQAIQELIDQHNSIHLLEAERFEWSLKTFPEETPVSALFKLKEEINEVREHLALFGNHNQEELIEEFADCLMCLFDSSGRSGIPPQQIFEAFSKKLVKNKARIWKKNTDNSYSHVK